MARLIPDTLFGRLAALLFFAVLASHGLALTLMFEVMGPPHHGAGGPPPAGPPPLFAVGLWLDIGIRLAALMIAAWIGARWLSKPMQQLADAAREFGNNINRAPLTEYGTQECRQTTRVFNLMQAQIQQQLQEKSSFVAAVSHDLRTPLTRMALRAESLADDEQRTKFSRDIAQMDAMIGVTLEYLQGAAHAEPRVLVDVYALLTSIVDDYQESRQPVQMVERPAGASTLPLVTQVSSLRRCVCNLVDNAVRYGGTALVSVHCTPDSTRIQVCDAGPGIPEAELAKVLRPFYRLEQSRNRDTGGVGLGLAIVNDAAHRLNAKFTLHNAESGGLVATLVFENEHDHLVARQAPHTHGDASKHSCQN